MERIQQVTWFAGLFEGEGSFVFAHGKPRALAIQMTDEDVLLKVQDYFGGTLCKVKKRQEHWKDCWKWTLTSSEAISLAKEILPFLGKRRSLRGQEFIDKYVTAEQYQENRKEKSRLLRNRVFSLRASGLTHKQIAQEIDKDRTYVSHILSGRYDMVDEVEASTL